MTFPDQVELADTVAAAAVSVSGVAGLHGGEFGEIATYLPGRKVVGIRIDDQLCEVHISAEYPTDLGGVAAGVRAAVQPLMPVPVAVTIEDVVETGARQ
ncbi:MAG: hypothetical protein WBQ44_04100 [Rhodococcus sp. (in: high G+C Gram-positive bacteria)]